MARGAKTAPSQPTEKDTQAAGGGPVAVGHPTFGEAALKLFDNGYAPIPIRTGEKRPAVKGWSDVRIDHAQVEAWAQEHATHGIGLLAGNLVGIDVDILDPDIAHQMGQIVERRIGSTLMRVGLWPKRLYLARTDTPFAKLQIGRLEVLARGQQLVAFGIHPDTQQPYYWPQGDSPLDIALSDLPLVNEADCKALLSELAGLQPEIGAAQLRRRSTSGVAMTSSGPVRHANGLVADGRDSWLSSLAYHVVHDARDLNAPLDPDTLAQRVWQRFNATTDLSRPKRDGAEFYALTDSLRKVRDKLGLLAAGRLPPRLLPDVEPVAVNAGLPIEEARTKLAAAIYEFCARTEAWHVSGHKDSPPRVGLRASVGLGKTAVSREHLLQTQAQLRAKGLPHRILVFTPSLALADESATGWMQEGVRVAVHRGYEAKMPGGDMEMCRDLDMVRMAIASGQSVFPNACMRRGGARCHNFEACAKQSNLAEVHRADVVLAAYDSLFSGLPIKADDVALLVIDEGCWERAIKRTQLALAEITAMDACSEPRMNDPDEEELAWTELFNLRKLVQQALRTHGPGVVPRQVLRTSGLSVDACERAAVLEVQLRVDPGLRPGLPQGARRRAVELSQDANRSVRREALFLALAQLLKGPAEQDGRIRVLPPDPITSGQHVLITGLHQVHHELQGLPVLHLDATLRPEIAATVLPGLMVTEITAAAPHMTLTAVQGRFAKSTLVADAKADVTENRRRANRLKECVDYVRWHATRVAPGRTLVVTYKAIECAFADIPGVVTGHFKAIAGLDSFKDVALLVVIGRPMPSDLDIAHLSGAYLAHVPTGGYRLVRRGLTMRNGSQHAFTVRQHEDPRAEEVRAAVCDDEVIQAIGRARGVNRTVNNPVDVHLLADVALPLVHDQVVSWELVCPDIFQQMLLKGLAVDSPGDAALIHPKMIGNAEQAKKAFQRGAFGGHFPIENTYREMSLKSARYRRGGKGRSWQRVWWIDNDDRDARQNLEAALGIMEGWNCDSTKLI